MAELPGAADELFALPPKDFTRRRNEMAKQLKAGGDNQGAQAVAALPKPSLSAWALNQVARWNSKMIKELVRIDETLRKPGSSTEFRRASGERNRIVRDIVEAASSILQNNGHTAGAAVVQKLTQTLLAIGTDEEARQALVHGRLVKDLDPGNQMWEVDVPAAESEPLAGDRDEAQPSAAEPDKAETERRRKQLSDEIDDLLRAADEQRRAAHRAREKAEKSRAEAEAADAAAQQAEQEADESAEEAERKRVELARLDL